MSVGMLFAVAFVPGFLPASLHVIYIAVRCGISPELGPALPKEERTHSFTQIAYMALQTSPIKISTAYRYIPLNGYVLWLPRTLFSN